MDSKNALIDMYKWAETRWTQHKDRIKAIAGLSIIITIIPLAVLSFMGIITWVWLWGPLLMASGLAVGGFFLFLGCLIVGGIGYLIIFLFMVAIGKWSFD